MMDIIAMKIEMAISGTEETAITKEIVSTSEIVILIEIGETMIATMIAITITTTTEDETTMIETESTIANKT